MDPPDDFDWPTPWNLMPVPEGYHGLVRSPEDELQSETCVGHLLFNIRCRAVAWNAADPNEFLVVTESPAIPIAFVHLTFQAESSPMWPYTVCYKTWHEFRESWKEQTDD